MKQPLSNILAVCALVGTLIGAGAAESRIRLNLNPVWRFQLGEPGGEPFAVGYDDSKWDIVSLPHAHELFPANLDGFREHGRNCGWYRRELQVPNEWLGKKVFLEFQGAMQTTALWVNGKKAGDYAVSGYDSFHFDLTPYLHAGKNLVAVKVDNRPNRDIPPDGTETDYILFGGLYRDVFLHVADTLHLTFPWEARQAGVRITLPAVSEQEAVVQAESTVRNESTQARKCTLVTEIRDQQGSIVKTVRDDREVPAKGEVTFTQKSEPIVHPHLWSPDNPYLYQVHTLVYEEGRELDHLQTPLGVRWVKFDREKGFFLNGQHLKLIGANRHQTWPFIGNAVPNSLHRRDAEQLKSMGVNWVRLSHYPHDPDFLDALDQLGLMALEEAPTWMRTGSAKWQTNLEASFRRMVRRDRNHPSIILWNTCINHGSANPRLVQAAKEEDPSRERGQDTVPLAMDFTPGQISGLGALSIEHTGHTFPAARGPNLVWTALKQTNSATPMKWTIRREHEQTRRHWEQVDAAYRQPDNAGLAVWCMYDYNTFHNASEPGVVWHGACDLFRLPKSSFYWHQSELTSEPMAYLVRNDETHATVFSNCEQVRLWQDAGQGYQEVLAQKADGQPGAAQPPTDPSALRHPPVQFVVGTNARALKVQGLIAGEVKATCEWKEPGLPVALTLEADRPTITADGADLSRIIVTAVDTNGTPIETCNATITFALEGLGQLIGENPTRLRAGKMIILAQSAFVPGTITIAATSRGLRPAKVPVRTQSVDAGVDMPRELPVQQPSKRAALTEHSTFAKPPNRPKAGTGDRVR